MAQTVLLNINSFTYSSFTYENFSDFSVFPQIHLHNRAMDDVDIEWIKECRIV